MAFKASAAHESASSTHMPHRLSRVEWFPEFVGKADMQEQEYNRTHNQPVNEGREGRGRNGGNWQWWR